MEAPEEPASPAESPTLTFVMNNKWREFFEDLLLQLNRDVVALGHVKHIVYLSFASSASGQRLAVSSSAGHRSNLVTELGEEVDAVRVRVVRRPGLSSREGDQGQTDLLTGTDLDLPGTLGRSLAGLERDFTG